MKKNNHQLRSEALKDALRRCGFGTPRTAVDSLIEQYLGKKSSLLGRGGTKRPSRKSVDPEERKRAEEQTERIRHSASLNQIAQALHCEGFNEFSAFGVLHYARTRLWGESYGVRADKAREAVQEAFKNCESAQRKAAGEFIHLQAAAAFESGLRIGPSFSMYDATWEKDLVLGIV